MLRGILNKANICLGIINNNIYEMFNINFD